MDYNNEYIETLKPIVINYLKENGLVKEYNKLVYVDGLEKYWIHSDSIFDIYKDADYHLRYTKQALLQTLRCVKGINTTFGYDVLDSLCVNTLKVSNLELKFYPTQEHKLHLYEMLHINPDDKNLSVIYYLNEGGELRRDVKKGVYKISDYSGYNEIRFTETNLDAYGNCEYIEVFKNGRLYDSVMLKEQNLWQTNIIQAFRYRIDGYKLNAWDEVINSYNKVKDKSSHPQMVSSYDDDDDDYKKTFLIEPQKYFETEMIRTIGIPKDFQGN